MSATPEFWTEAQIRAAFRGSRRIPVYPGPDTTAEAHTAGSLMYQLRLQRRREQECIRWTGPWPDADVADFLARDRAARAHVCPYGCECPEHNPAP